MALRSVHGSSVQHSTAERTVRVKSSHFSKKETADCLTDRQIDVQRDDKFGLVDYNIHQKSWSVSFQIEGQWFEDSIRPNRL